MLLGLGLGGVLLVPAVASAEEEAGQQPQTTQTTTGVGESTTTQVRAGQVMTTKRDADGRVSTKVVKTEPGSRTTVVTKTVARGGSPVVAKLTPVYFQTSSDKIEDISKPLLDATAASIKSNPRIQVVEVHGHADQRGAQEYNQDLTDRRAQAVSDALQERGVPADRIQSQGFGDTKPVCDQNDADCWSQNRRVDIIPRAGQ
jgi:outer membrane protein OmpA-like peptidoglycan-associated protein